MNRRRDPNRGKYSALADKTCSWAPWIFALLAVAGWALAIFFGYLWTVESQQEGLPPPFPASPSWSARFRHGAVAADNGACSEIGRDVLKEGGNAVDAAIATLVCDGIQNPHSMGLGGGFFMVVYNRSNGACTTINARETAPAFATEREFPDKLALMNGWKAMGVPGELMGYWTAHQQFGNTKWRRLWEPSIQMASEGFYVSKVLADALSSKWIHKALLNESTLSLYVNPETGDVYKEGDFIKDPLFAHTLKRLANANPVQLFYGGAIGRALVNEVETHDGILTLEDLKNYRIQIKDGWTLDLPGNKKLCSLGVPSGGPGVGLYLALLQALNVNRGDGSWTDTINAHHQMMEASKIAYAHWRRFQDGDNQSQLESKIKDRNYVAELARLIGNRASDDLETKLPFAAESGEEVGDRGGTAHISVLDRWGNAVSVTSSINYYFGFLKRSPTTGIVWNNHLVDFSLEGDVNRLRPGLRPRSAMSPVIVYDGDSRQPFLVSGASGGSKILGTVGYVLGRVLFLNETIKEATDAVRFVPDLEKNRINLEPGMPSEFLDRLKRRGHKFGSWLGRSVGQSVLFDGLDMFAISDHRKESYPAGY